MFPRGLGWLLTPPPPLSATDTLPLSSAQEDDDLNDEFISTLGVIHHNPNINFDAEMSAFSSDDKASCDVSKRRKRDVMDASPFNTLSP